MAAHGTKSKTDAPNKAARESKTAEATPKPGAGKTETGKTETGKTDAGMAETGKTAEAAPQRQGMGEGQKPVSQAYKDNWNAIFAKKPAKKRKR